MTALGGNSRKILLGRVSPALLALVLCLSVAPGSNAQSKSKARHSGALAQSSRESEIHYQKGLEAFAKHDYTQAVHEFRLSVAHSLKSPKAHNMLGAALLESGQVDAAAVEFRKAIALQPVFPEAYYNMGRALEARRDLDGAITFYQGAIHQRPDWAEVHDALGNVLGHRGNLLGARDEFQKAVDAKPDDAQALFHLGVADWFLQDAKGAEKELEAAVKYQPANAEAHYYLGLACRQNGQDDRGLSELRGAVKLSGKSQGRQDPLCEEIPRCVEAAVDLERRAGKSEGATVGGRRGGPGDRPVICRATGGQHRERPDVR